MSSFPNAKANTSPFNPAEFYALASWLYDTRPTPCSEALKRTIINRAYYAALICARDFTGKSTTGQDGHKSVVTALKHKNSRAGNNLDALRQLRHRADYECSSMISDRDLGISLQNSLSVLNATGKTLASSKPYTCNFLDASKFI